MTGAFFGLSLACLSLACLPVPAMSEPGYLHISTGPAGRSAAAELIDRSAAACGRVPEDYRIPCLADHLRQAAERVRDVGLTSQVLEEAADRMMTLSAQTDDRSRRWRRVRSVGLGGNAATTVWPLFPEAERPARHLTLRILAGAESALLETPRVRRDGESLPVARALGRLALAVRG